MDQISRLIDIVGNAGVLSHPVLGDTYSLDDRLILHNAPSLSVKPRNVDEVQKIILWANETQTPIVPISSGEPHFHGDTLPSVPEAVMIDLSSMNRILKINRRNRLALIEPGVTYSQLLPALKDEGLRVVMPLLPRGNKSVLTSLLEREPVMFPRYQWNLSEPLRSLEIVWGNGDKFYSGSGTFRGEKDEDWELGLVPVTGPGPGQLDFYKLVSAAQGSMGIVTWASVKCEVYSELHKLFFAPSERLEPLIDFMYRLLRFRFGEELFIMNRTCLAYLLASEPDKIAILNNSLPPWIAVVGISGGQLLPDERIEAQEKDIQDLARQFGLEMRPSIEGCRGDDLLEQIRRPSAEPFWKLRYKGGSQEIFFLTTLDKTTGFITTINSAAAERQYPILDIGIYLQPVHQGVGCHCEFILPFDRKDQAEVMRAEALFRDASHRLFEQKAYFSRPYGIWADMIYNADPMTTTVSKEIKGIFDPNHVMNPGKLCF